MEMKSSMKTLVEKYFGQTIPETEYQKALLSAVQKLNVIIERDGDANGERRKPYYLAQLIQDAVSESNF